MSGPQGPASWSMRTNRSRSWTTSFQPARKTAPTRRATATKARAARRRSRSGKALPIGAEHLVNVFAGQAVALERVFVLPEAVGRVALFPLQHAALCVRGEGSALLAVDLADEGDRAFLDV